MSGVLYGIGVGPGDPELITLKAARLIEAAPIVAFPALPGVESMARGIAAGLIGAGTLELAVEVPMTRAREPAQVAYDLGAARIGEALAAGENVVFLCEGDPLFYGSFMYLHARLAERFTVEVVPGVTSVSAAAARAGRPLAARNAVLAVIPAPLDDATIRKRMEGADSAVIVKVGRHLGRVRTLLDDIGLAQTALYAERASLPGERLLPLSEAPDPAPYFSMILVSKGGDPWL